MAPPTPFSDPANTYEDGSGSDTSPTAAFMDWDQCKADVESLYCESGLPLRRVMEIIKMNHGFSATEKQYKDKIKSWNFGKNLQESDIPHLIRLFRQAREDAGKPRVKLRGRIIDRPRIDAYLRRKGKSEDEVLANASQSIPAYIKLEYPPPEDCLAHLHLQTQQRAVRPSEMVLAGTKTLSALLNNQPNRLPTPTTAPSTSIEPINTSTFGPQIERPAFHLKDVFRTSNSVDVTATLSGYPPHPAMSEKTPDFPDSDVISRICSQLDDFPSYRNVIDQIMRSGSPASDVSSQLNMFGVLSRSPDLSVTGAETLGPDNAADLPRRFLLHFFIGCMLFRNESPQAACESFRHANNLLQVMIRTCHPGCLITLHYMLSVHEALDQNHIAGDFLGSVLVFSRSHTAGNPVAAITEFMVSAATRKVSLVAKEIDQLESLQRNLQARFSPESSSALLGMYQVAWRAAKTRKDHDRARQILTDLIPLATKVLGQSHFLTFSCVTTMSRVLFHLHKREESVTQMEKALSSLNLKYVPDHPLRLEALYRLARLLIDCGQCAKSVDILKEVVRRRANMMSPTNRLTIRALQLCREALLGIGFDISVDVLSERLLSSVNGPCENATRKVYLPVDSLT